jgi:putative endonuclease
VPYTVYVLVSESTGSRYIGQTNDLDRRLAEHNDPDHNRRKHTSRTAGPWRLACSQEYPTRSEAMRRERWLESGVGRAWLDGVLNGWLKRPLADAELDKAMLREATSGNV